MKISIAIILATGLLFTACESEEITPEEYEIIYIDGVPVDGDGFGDGDGGGGSGTVSCILNGEEWNATSCTGTYLIDNEIERNELSVTGTLGDFMMSLGMKGIYVYGATGIDLGTYEGNSDSDKGFVILSESGPIVGSAPGIDIGHALITLTEFDYSTKLCSGTFEFSAVTTEAPDEIGFAATDGVFEDVLFSVVII